MNKENIIYTNDDFIVFKDKPSRWSLGNMVGKSLKEIEKIEGKEIKEVYRYVMKKKTIYRDDKELKEKTNGR